MRRIAASSGETTMGKSSFFSLGFPSFSALEPNEDQRASARRRWCDTDCRSRSRASFPVGSHQKNRPPQGAEPCVSPFLGLDESRLCARRAIRGRNKEREREKRLNRLLPQTALRHWNLNELTTPWTFDTKERHQLWGRNKKASE